MMRWLKYVAAAVTVAPIVIVLRLLSVSYAGIAAPLLLLDVVVVARLWGTGPALVAAASGAGAYSYYFLPPAGFGIEDAEDWIAFVTFIVTAVIAGELASRAERRAAEAQAGRQEIERLYQELQAAFERASEAEAARRNEQLKAALLDALTHNLRTPLTSIKAAVTALIRSGVWSPASELSSEGRSELLQVIDEESDRLNRFIEGLSAPERAAPMQPIHLRAIRRRYDSAVGAQPRRNSDPRSPRRRDHRRARRRRVGRRRLDHRSDLHPAGQREQVRTGGHEDHHAGGAGRRAERPDHGGDEGPGIPEALRERVFEKFFRVPGRESHDVHRGGIGLGLPIARRLVEAQGGRIWIETAPPSGTAVVMIVPAAAAAEQNGTCRSERGTANAELRTETENSEQLRSETSQVELTCKGRHDGKRSSGNGAGAGSRR